MDILALGELPVSKLVPVDLLAVEVFDFTLPCEGYGCRSHL